MYHLSMLLDVFVFDSETFCHVTNSVLLLLVKHSPDAALSPIPGFESRLCLVRSKEFVCAGP